MREAVPSFVRQLRAVADGAFFKNVAAMFAGTLATQVLNVAVAPVLTRLFSPEAFGGYGVFNYIMALLTPFAALCYPLAIILARDMATCMALVRLCIAVSLAVALAVLCVVWFGIDYLIMIPGTAVVGPFLHLLPLAVLSSGLMQTAQYWAMRQETFGPLAYASSLHSLLINGLRVGAGIVVPTAGALISIAATAPSVLAAMIVWKASRPAPVLAVDAPGPARQLPLTDMWQAARTFRAFPLFRVPQNVIRAAAFGVPLIFLAHYADAAAAGHYTLAMQALMLPSQLIGVAIANVFYARLAKVASEGEQARQLRRITLLMAGIGALPHLVVMMFGPGMFAFVFGEAWRPSGELARWMSPWLFIAFCSLPSLVAVPVLGLERLLLGWEVANVMVAGAVLYLGFSYGFGTVAVMQIFSCFAAIMSVAFMIAVLSSAERAARAVPGGAKDDASN